VINMATIVPSRNHENSISRLRYITSYAMALILVCPSCNIETTYYVSYSKLFVGLQILGRKIGIGETILAILKHAFIFGHILPRKCYFKLEFICKVSSLSSC
jgi:hypothetical protein